MLLFACLGTICVSFMLMAIGGPDRWPSLAKTAEEAVGGAGPLYYLALAGCAVELYDEHALPGDRLARWLPEGVPPAALGRDVEGILQAGIVFLGGRKLEQGFVDNVRVSHEALVLYAGPSGLAEADGTGLQPADLRQAWTASPGTFVCGRPEDEGTVAEAAAAGRRTAVDVVQYLEALGK